METLYVVGSPHRNVVALELEIRAPLSIEIVHIQSVVRRCGKATRVLADLCRAADRWGVTLRLEARAIDVRDGGGRALDQSALEGFYMRRGFAVSRHEAGKAVMHRKPQSSCCGCETR